MPDVTYGLSCLSRKAARSSPSALAAALALVLLTLPFGGCATPTGNWVPMEAQQIAVTLTEGTTVVGVRDLREGWTEWVRVERDGQNVMGDVVAHRVSLRDEVDLDAESTQFFRTEVGAGVADSGDTVERAYALCLWVADRTYGRRPERQRSTVERDGVPRRVLDVTSNGRAALESIDVSGKIGCTPLANIYMDAARAYGLIARRVDLIVRHSSPYEAHSVAEVWSPEHERWVIIDPTFSMYFTLNGLPAGALDMQDAILGNRLSGVRVVRSAKARGLDPGTYQINPLLYFRNVYFRVLPDDGAWLSSADSRVAPATVATQQILQSDSTDVLKLPPRTSREIQFSKGQVAGRLAYQALHGRLFICLENGLFEPGRFQLSLPDMLQAQISPESPGYVPTDILVAAPEEYSSNPTFADLDADKVPDGWHIEEGSPLFTRNPAGELVVETGDAECIISRREPGAEGLPLVTSLVAQVEQGEIEFSIRQRRKGDLLRISPGALGVHSPVILQPKPERLRLRLLFAPHTRCRLVQLTLRRERLLYEVVGSPVEPSNRASDERIGT